MPGHIPVLLAETIEALRLRSGDTFVEATAGLGGHAEAAARLVGPGGRIVLNDLDPGNLRRAAQRVGAAAGCELVAIHGNFAELPRALPARGLGADALLADLGFASSQMDDPERGLSMRADGPLDMRLDPAGPVTAAELINTLPSAEMARILREFGEEPAAARIARKLAQRRTEAPILRTGELAELVRAAIGPGGRRGAIDPATRTFQALRIAVNDELASLASLLGAIERAPGRRPGAGQAEPQRSWLNRGARVAVISFHSLEDRMVKRCFARMVRGAGARSLTDGAVIAGEREVRENPRSRSARLRAIELDATE